MTWWTCLLADESPFPQREGKGLCRRWCSTSSPRLPPTSTTYHFYLFVPIFPISSAKLANCSTGTILFFFFVYEKYKQCGKIVLPLFCFCTYINPVNRVIPSEDRVYSHIASSVFLVWQHWCSNRYGRVMYGKQCKFMKLHFHWRRWERELYIIGAGDYLFFLKICLVLLL